MRMYQNHVRNIFGTGHRNAARSLISTVAFLAMTICLLADGTQAFSINSGRGLTYVRSAWATPRGHLNITAHTRFFGQVGALSDASSVTFWDIQGALGFNYGINDKFELDIAPIVYQDHQKGGNGYNLPDDLFLRLKLGNLSSRGSSFSFASQVQFRFPTGEFHNVPFEPYSAGAFEWGLLGIISYANDPLYPDEAFNFHLNLGYNNHNDVGRTLVSSDGVASDANPQNMSQSFLYGLGLVVPTRDFDFSVQVFGDAPLQKPPAAAYSREGFTFLSPGVTYKAYNWLAFDFTADFRITPDKNDTDYSLVPELPELPNYPGWRVNLGIRWTALPSSVYHVSERDMLIQKAESRRELFERIIKEQRETETAEEELERIKDERRKAERELERLRRILEGEARKRREREADRQQQLEPTPEAPQPEPQSEAPPDTTPEP